MTSLDSPETSRETICESFVLPEQKFAVSNHKGSKTPLSPVKTAVKKFRKSFVLTEQDISM